MREKVVTFSALGLGFVLLGTMPDMPFPPQPDDFEVYAFGPRWANPGGVAVELELPIAAGTYWMLAEEQFGDLLEAQSNVLHACEAETSMVLALRPELVDTSALERI